MCHMDDKEVPGKELMQRELFKSKLSPCGVITMPLSVLVANLELLGMEFIRLAFSLRKSAWHLVQK